jgi:hypothetical protein
VNKLQSKSELIAIPTDNIVNGKDLRIKNNKWLTNIQTKLQDVYVALPLQELHEGI